MGLAAIPDRHWQFIETCHVWYMADDYIFVHATLQPDRPLAQQSETALFWDKLVYPQPHQSGKTMVCGHTPQRSGHPFNVGHAICLDTAACEGQWLTCLEVFSGEVWQANQQASIENRPISTTFSCRWWVNPLHLDRSSLSPWRQRHGWPRLSDCRWATLGMPPPRFALAVSFAHLVVTGLR
jgi:hypothetical protein